VSRVQVELTDIAFQGAAIGRANDQVVFAAYGIPGETVTVEVERERRDYLQGRVLAVVKPSPARVEPPCPYFGECGGCQWQHIDYQQQVQFKRHIVREQLRRIGKFDDPPVSPTISSPDPYGYRNQARLTVGPDGQLGFVSRPGRARRFLRIDRCLIMHPAINAVLAKLQGRARVKHQVVIRWGVNTGQLLVQPELSRQLPDVPSGQPFYEEELLGRRFRISASSFFQTHTKQAERLVELVRERIQPTGQEVVVDAYAGVGTFAVLLAPEVRRVVAIEESSSAVEDAQYNLQGIDNVEYIRAKVEDVLGDLAMIPDVVILDPPRVGCHPDALQAVLRLKPRRLVYVSCDPSTLARDVRVLCDGGYRLRDVTPVDMFPQTYHIESVSTLELA